MIVGITQRIDKIKSYDEVRNALDQKLVDWVLSAGFIPLLIPNTLAKKKILVTRQQQLFNWLKIMKVKAILLSGGNDIGEEPLRDLLEKSLLFTGNNFGDPIAMLKIFPMHFSLF